MLLRFWFSLKACQKVNTQQNHFHFVISVAVTVLDKCPGATFFQIIRFAPVFTDLFWNMFSMLLKQTSFSFYKHFYVYFPCCTILCVSMWAGLRPYLCFLHVTWSLLVLISCVIYFCLVLLFFLSHSCLRLVRPK